MKDVLTVTEREGKVRVINAAAEASTGWAPDPLARRPLAEVFQIDTKARVQTKRIQVHFPLRRRNVVTWPKHRETPGPHPDAA